jgi:hydrogenase maturation factor
MVSYALHLRASYGNTHDTGKPSETKGHKQDVLLDFISNVSQQDQIVAHVGYADKFVHAAPDAGKKHRTIPFKTV